MLRERRWVVLAAGALLTLLGCVAVYWLVPAKYEKQASVVMLPPELKVDGQTTNPFLRLAGLEGISDVLAVSMRGPEVAERVDPAGGVEYQVQRDLTLSGPVLLVQVTGDDSAEVSETLDRILGQIPETLEGLQTSADVAKSSWVTSLVVTKDADIVAARKSQIRALLVVVAAGASLTYLSLALVSGLIQRRSGRGSSRGDGLSSLLVTQSDSEESSWGRVRQGGGS